MGTTENDSPQAGEVTAGGRAADFNKRRDRDARSRSRSLNRVEGFLCDLPNEMAVVDCQLSQT